MKLFENKVGRPSKEILKKRKIFYTVIAAAIILFVSGSVLAFNYVKTGSLVGAAASCQFPYTKAKCSSTKNDTVKKTQNMLANLTYKKNGKYYKYYTDSQDGYYGSKTASAIQKFQSVNNMLADGNLGPDTLKAIATKAKVKYYVINYNKNGGSGTLNNSYNNKIVIINGIAAYLPTVKLTKSGYTHVGWYAYTTVNGAEYTIGCTSKNCTGGAKGYKTSLGNVYSYLYGIGGGSANTGWINGQTITMKAVYCKTGQTYDRTKSACVGNAVTTKKTTEQKVTTTKKTAGTGYNYTASLTGYGPEAAGAQGAVACVSKRFSSSNLTYYDSEYGSLRVLANGYGYNGGLGCGTVIEIQSLTEGSKKTAVRGIVLDNGSGSAIDLMTQSESYASRYVGRQTIKYKILRRGW